MTYAYKVTLTGIKGFYRTYHLNAGNTLYSFHKQMRSDMEFPQDQLILFKALDKDGSVIFRYGLFDLGDGTVDNVKLSDTVKAGVCSFVYYYDVTNKKSVNISFEGEVQDNNISTPVIVELKGPNPIEFENGYVAFEDLPDEKRRLPGESSDKDKKSSLADILGINIDDLDDDEEGDEEDGEEEEGEEEVFDENEEFL